jgi:hypothetical protein
MAYRSIIQKTDPHPLGVITFVAVALTLTAALAAAPSAGLLMLALGNFGFPQFGFIDCLPAGLLIGMVASSKASAK